MIPISIAYKAASPGVDFAAGVVAGAAGLIVGQPFDVVKVRYQSAQFNGKYGNTFGAIGAIMREEGTKGLFKGVMSPMAGIAFINGVVFTSYSFFMKLQVHSHASTEPTLAQITLAGAGSGVLGSLIACPTELIKIRQQSAPPHLYPSTLSVFTNVLRQGGVRGLYRGFSATAMRDVAYGPYFCTYEAVCRFFKSRKPQPQAGFGESMSPEPNPSRQSQHSHANLIEEAEQELSVLTWPELMTAGGLAGVIAWMATFPLDVLKTRMQAAQWTPGSGNTVIQGGGAVLTASRAPTLRYIATEAIRREGWRVMFAGLGPTLIRAVPANMVIFLTFEGIVTQLK